MKKCKVMNFVEELRWRGMIQEIMPGTEEQLQKELTSGYLGIDPTADSLHIGHLVGGNDAKAFSTSWTPSNSIGWWSYRYDRRSIDEIARKKIAR